MLPLERSVSIYQEMKERLKTLYGLEEDEQTLVDTLEGCCDLQEQIAALAREGLAAEAMAEGMKEHIRANQERKTRLEQKGERLRSLVKWAMAEAGLAKIPAPDMTLSISAPKKSPLIISNDAIIPDELCKIEVVKTPIKDKIRAWISPVYALDGTLTENTIPGVSFGNADPVLTIRKR